MTQKNSRLNFYKTICSVEDYLKQGYAGKRPNISRVVLKKQEAVSPALLQSPSIAIKDHLDGGSPDAFLASSMSELTKQIEHCSYCHLSKTRKNSVAGYGSVPSKLLIVGDAPSSDDEHLKEPFKGLAGQFLDKWLASINLSRDQDCYLTTMIKCRPPQAREANKQEIEQCFSYFSQLVDFVKPKVILCCGRTAAQTITNSQLSLTALREHEHYFKDIKVIVTYHPLHVLQNDELKRPVWEDLKKIKILLE